MHLHIIAQKIWIQWLITAWEALFLTVFVCWSKKRLRKYGRILMKIYERFIFVLLIRIVCQCSHGGCSFLSVLYPFSFLGPIVWFQKFEYAVGHWLQKATEHVLGCVLCSPGCFSLFRGSALMDDNIMKKYTSLPTSPGHYLQYDQGGLLTSYRKHVSLYSNRLCCFIWMGSSSRFGDKFE